MGKNLFYVLAAAFVFGACNKSSSTTKCGFATITAVAPSDEVFKLKSFLDSKSLTYTQHPSGIFYQVITPGSGIIPVVCSDVTVKYAGNLTDTTAASIDGIGSGFDSSYVRYPNGISFTLGQLIAGWQIGIPLIQKGGSIILYIPPSLAYGSAGRPPSIPPNSNLIFKIELLNVQ